MNILVTGHQGYIGSVLVPMLVDQGHQVSGLDAGFFESCQFTPDKISIPYIRKDIREVLIEDVKGYDAILHLAALSNDPMGDLNPEATRQINFEGTLQLARLAKRAGVKRFLFSSSCSTYGASGDSFIDEDAPFCPVTPYGETKVLAEQALAELADEHFCPIFLRNATAYGVSSRIRFDLVVNNLIAWAVTTGKVRLKSDGMAWRPLVHIEDISRAFIALLEADEEKVRGQAYNVGQTSENYLVRELAQMVTKVVPNCTITFADGASSDSRNYRVNCDRIQREIPGFEPQWNVLKGMQEIYRAIVARDLTVDEFEGSRYMRLAHLKMKQDEGELDSELHQRVPTAS